MTRETLWRLGGRSAAVRSCGLMEDDDDAATIVGTGVGNDSAPTGTNDDDGDGNSLRR